MRSVAIVPGWSEGPWQSQNFRKQLKTKGFEIIKSAATAEIIVAHSAGCFWLPKKPAAKLIILIGPNYWPGRSYFISAVLNTLDGLRHHRAEGSVIWWANKLLHNTFYVLSRPQATFRLMQRIRADNLPPAKHGQKIILVRNKRDAFTHPEIQKIFPETSHYELIEFDGDHEDCWLNPRPYIDLIEKELK